MRRSVPVLVIVLIFVSMMATPVYALSLGEVHFDKRPLAPGETTGLSISVTNSGDAKKDVVVRLKHTMDLGIGGQESSKAIGILDGSEGLGDLRHGEREKADFKIFAAPNAEEGIYNLEIKASYRVDGIIDRSGSETLGIISVEVIREPPRVIISKISDKVIAPGSVDEINVELKNAGKSRARDVMLEVAPSEKSSGTESIDLSSLSGITKMLGISLPSFGGEAEAGVSGFSVVGSGSSFYIGDLNPDETCSVDITLAVDPETKKGVYNLPIAVSYLGGSSSSNAIGIRVMSKAELFVPEIETDPVEVKPGETAMLMVTIENIGKNDAKSVRVNLIETEWISATAFASYIGTIVPDDEGMALFDVNVTKGAPEELPVAFNVSYTDDMGDHFVIERGEINVVPTKNTSNTGNTGNTGLISMAILIVPVLLIIGIFYFYRKRKGSKPGNPGNPGNLDNPGNPGIELTQKGVDALDRYGMVYESECTS
jgi:LPXTG-motif cell wall-anchored protein